MTYADDGCEGCTAHTDGRAGQSIDSVPLKIVNVTALRTPLLWLLFAQECGSVCRASISTGTI